MREFPRKLREKMYAGFQSKILASSVNAAISAEIDKLGFQSRAIALKRSFKILSPEVTSNGIVYRIRSDSRQIPRLTSGTVPDARYTMGAKKLGNGMFSGTMPTRIGDKIAAKVQAVLYEQISDIFSKTMGGI